MSQFIRSTFFTFFFLLNAPAYSQELSCHFSDRVVEGVSSIVVKGELIIINGEVEVPLEKSEINCSNFGRQLRFDGNEQGYQVILKSCTSEASLEGVVIDTIQQQVGDILCL